MTVLFTVIEFLCGSLMFSYWLGLAVKVDLRTVGDGNPGAFNLWHSAGYKIGLLGVFLEFTKGYLPLAILIDQGYAEGFALVPIAIAPILGHAFSPFLKFRGGKTVAVTFGVWSAVTRFEVSVTYAVILAVFTVAVKFLKRGKAPSSEEDGLMVVFGMLILGVYLKIREFSADIAALWLANLIIMAFANRSKLHGFFKNYSVKEKHT